MTEFLRRVRQNLLSDGKTSKYLIFAIGEIVLVMLGILLALQVDNWNENRKLLQIQNDALNKLKMDLSYDIERFHELDSTYNEWLKDVDHILNDVLDGTTRSLSSTKDYIVGRGSMNYLTLSKSTYNEMINTGIVYQIKNKEVSQILVNYYDTSDFELEKLNADNRDLYNWVLNASTKESYRIVFRLQENRNLEYIDWGWLKDPNSPLYIELESKVSFFKTAIQANQSVIEILRKKGILVIEAINDYQQQQ